MKQINVYFESDEFENISKFKNNLSWHDFIILMFTHCLDAQRKGDFEIGEKSNG